MINPHALNHHPVSPNYQLRAKLVSCKFPPVAIVLQTSNSFNLSGPLTSDNFSEA